MSLRPRFGETHGTDADHGFDSKSCLTSIRGQRDQMCCKNCLAVTVAVLVTQSSEGVSAWNSAYHIQQNTFSLSGGIENRLREHEAWQGLRDNPQHFVSITFISVIVFNLWQEITVYHFEVLVLDPFFVNMFI